MVSNRIAIFGLGRVGLPLGLVLTEKGYFVDGIEINEKYVELLSKKRMPFIEEGASVLLKKYGGIKFRVFSYSDIGKILIKNKYIIITIGTTVNEAHTPDLSHLIILLNEIAPFLAKNHTIILRSTITPGSLERIASLLEDKTGLRIGKDLFLAYCPERITEGKSISELKQIPQIIGATDSRSGKIASRIFKKIAPKILFASAREAELAKLFCNAYRYVNFAVGNEFMMISEDNGCDIYKVINLINNGYERGGVKPPGFTAGSCLVKDSFFLTDKNPYSEMLISAWKINEGTPSFLIRKLKSLVPDLSKKKVAILGITFKKDVDDTRSSLALKLKNYLLEEGANVSTYDPYFNTKQLKDTLNGAEIIFFGVNHTIFKNLDFNKFTDLISPDCLVCDIWNIFGYNRILFRIRDIIKLN